MGSIEQINESLMEEEADLEEVKNQIIRDKNDMLFGYITQEKALESFEETKKILDLLTASYQVSLEKVLLITDNPEKKKHLKEVELNIYQTIEKIKHLMDQYKQTEVVQFAKDAIVAYNKELAPKLSERRELVYAYTNTDYPCELIQNRTSIEQFEYNYGNKDPFTERMDIANRSKKGNL
jgi:hypothetical protein